MRADWTNLILGPELHRGRLGHLRRATPSKAPGPTELVLRLADARLAPALRDLVTRESELAVRVTSPFVVAHELITQDRERPFSVMAHVDGLSLDTLLLDTAAHEAPRLLLPAVLDAIEGLVALHAARDADGPLRVVHQAPVPRHIVVGVDGVARLVDLTQALSRVHPYSPALATLLRADELAPEQASEPEHVDARTDVFIAADTFFRVLTCTRARSGASRSRPPGAALPPQVGAAHAMTPELERVLSWALARDPGARTGSAEALLDALREALTHTHALATREELGAHVRRLQSQHKAGSAERSGLTRPFASTYALRTGPETVDTPSAPPGPRSDAPRAPSSLPAPPSPPRRDYWFALYRDEHEPDAPAAPSPLAVPHDSKPGLAGAQRAPLGADDTAARRRVELGPVLYVAPPWSSPPPVLSPPYPDAERGRSRTHTALLTGLGLLGVAVTTVLVVGWLDSPRSSASQAPAVLTTSPAVQPAPVAQPVPDARPSVAPSSAADAQLERSEPSAPSAPLRRARGVLGPKVAKRAAERAPAERAPAETPTPTLTRQDFLPDEP